MSLINGTTIEVLNFEKIFKGYFAGTWDIFFIIVLIVFTILAAKFRMNNITFLMLWILFAILMVMQGLTMPLFVVVTLIAGLIGYIALSKMTKE